MSPIVPVLLFVLTPLVFAVSIQNTVSQSVLSKTVSPAEVGGAFGLSAAVQNIGSIAAPIIGGAIIGAVGTWAPGLLAALVCLGLAPFAWAKFAKPGAPFSLVAQAAEAEPSAE